MICGRLRFRRACILLRFPLPIGAAKRGFREGCTSLSIACATFEVILGFITMGIFLAAFPPTAFTPPCGLPRRQG